MDAKASQDSPDIMPIAGISKRQDFFELMRRIEKSMHALPRFCTRLECDLERLQIHQPADFSFASREVAALEQQVDNGKLHISLALRHFGPFAPYGALPIEITEHIRQEKFISGHPAAERFLNLPVTRLATLYYRAWSQLKESVGHDRNDDNLFLLRLSNTVGVPPVSAASIASEPVRVLRQAFPGAYSYRRGSLPQLQKILTHYFSLPVQVRPRAGGWITPLPSKGHKQSAARLGRAMLGEIHIGRCFFDAQHRIAIRIGPVSQHNYLDWRRGSRRLAELEQLIADFVGHRVVCQISLDIVTTPAMSMHLGQPMLGCSSWLKAASGIHSQLLRNTNHIHPTGVPSC